MASTDPKELPDTATWYLVTNLLHPTSFEKTQQESKLEVADLSEIMRLYGLRM